MSVAPTAAAWPEISASASATTTQYRVVCRVREGGWIQRPTARRRRVTGSFHRTRRCVEGTGCVSRWTCVRVSRTTISPQGARRAIRRGRITITTARLRCVSENEILTTAPGLACTSFFGRTSSLASSNSGPRLCMRPRMILMNLKRLGISFFFFSKSCLGGSNSQFYSSSEVFF